MTKIILLILLTYSSAFAIGPQFVQNSNIFSGEVASNLTSGAPLSVSSTGKITTGITFTEVTSTTNATTTATTDGLMTTMTITPVAGTYLVIFSGTFASGAAGNTVTFSIYNGTTQVAASVRDLIPWSSAALSTTQDEVASTNGVLVMNGTNAVQIEWHSSAASGATVRSRTLDIVRLQ